MFTELGSQILTLTGEKDEEMYVVGSIFNKHVDQSGTPHYHFKLYDLHPANQWTENLITKSHRK